MRRMVDVPELPNVHYYICKGHLYENTCYDNVRFPRCENIIQFVTCKGEEQRKSRHAGRLIQKEHK